MFPLVPRVAPRAALSALFAITLSGALAAPSVRAAPLSLAPPLDTDDALVVQQMPDDPPAPPVRLAARNPVRDRMGGGFIEFLFGGNTAGAAPREERSAAAAPAALVAAEPGQAPMDPKYLPQTVDYAGPEKPGTIIIDTPHRFLFLVEPGGVARRYGIGVGRPGFTWAGVKEITAKREWPDWRPPPEMLARQPYLPTFMAGGPENPLGARAMYLGSSLYRIHGSNEPWTIGGAVSSGCIRMRNEDVIDLYNRVKVGTRVIVI
jgi:lipoprotein-anchoring transpeptidase ErfK/SrfK